MKYQLCFIQNQSYWFLEKKTSILVFKIPKLVWYRRQTQKLVLVFHTSYSFLCVIQVLLWGAVNSHSLITGQLLVFASIRVSAHGRAAMKRSALHWKFHWTHNMTLPSIHNPDKRLSLSTDIKIAENQVRIKHFAVATWQFLLHSKQHSQVKI